MRRNSRVARADGSQVSFGTPVFDDLDGYRKIPLTSMPYGQSLALLARRMRGLVVEVFEHHELCASKALPCPAGGIALGCHVVKAIEGVDRRRGRRAKQRAGAVEGHGGGIEGGDGE